MYALFAQYYDEVSRERFDQDMDAKHEVILLRNERGQVRGFSTMRDLEVCIDGKMHYGLFSGDTVVAREHWGQRVLGRVFLRELFRKKARHPLSPYYWFLISKGYKTYLLMANNFGEHYPRHEKPTPKTEQAVLDAFASEMFPEAYDPTTGVLSFSESLGQLKPGIADITEELCEKNPRVAFYEAKNPTWRQGTELACIARMSFSMPAYYSLKALFKGARRAAEPAKRRLMRPSFDLSALRRQA